MVETRRSSRAAEPPFPTLAEAVANLRRTCTSTSSTPVSSKHAAVLVPLFESSDGEIHVILTQRSAKMRKHAGEVCFPGGKREPGDSDDIATALRESKEELGLDPECVNVVASMPPVLSKHLLSVTPVIATVPSKCHFTPNPAEVEHVFSAPLRMFLETGPGYSYRDLNWGGQEGGEGFPYRLHYWDYTYRGQTFLVWGLTAGMLVVVAEQALGRPAKFQVHPPGAVPYTALAFEKGKIVFRGWGGSGGRGGGGGAPLVGAGSAAVPGAMVTDAEAEAAVGGDTSAAEGEGNGENSGPKRQREVEATAG